MLFCNVWAEQSLKKLAQIWNKCFTIFGPEAEELFDKSKQNDFRSSTWLEGEEGSINWDLNFGAITLPLKTFFRVPLAYQEHHSTVVINAAGVFYEIGNLLG